VPDPLAPPPIDARPPDDRPTPDPDRLAFWGPDRAALARPRLAAWLDRVARDPRAGAVALLVVALAAGLVWYRLGARDAPVTAPAPAASRARPAASATTSTSRAADIVVHVAGVVVRPGIVRLPDGARVVDAIEAAGGAAPGADLDRLNLAAEVTDGQRVAVARPGEPIENAVDGSAGTAATGTAPPGAPLDLNTATQADLEALPGIGPVLGAAILRERERRGGFRSIDDLRSVRGIGEQRFADLRGLVTV
jgi:competence protein ComEA